MFFSNIFNKKIIPFSGHPLSAASWIKTERIFHLPLAILTKMTTMQHRILITIYKKKLIATLG